MPQFSDDLFLGTAQTYMGVNTNSNLGDPSPMDVGVGPTWSYLCMGHSSCS